MFPAHRRAGAVAAVALLLFVLAPAIPAQSSAPTVSSVVIDARATAARVSWQTDAPALGSVEYESAGAATRVVDANGTSSSHSVLLTHLTPGATVTFRILATSAGGSATHASSFNTTTGSVTYYLHNTGAAAVKTADDFDTPGDNDGRGYNGLGAAASTTAALTGVDLLATHDLYAAASGGLRLAPGTAVATLYVKFIASGPTVSGVGTTLARGAPAAATFRVTLLADGRAVGTGTGDLVSVPGADAWHPVTVNVTIPAAADAQPGGLAIRVSADKATAGYVFGFEGDHASRVADVPVLSGAPAPRVLKTDFTQGARVVVAVIDSGINPYHPVFRRPGATLPLADLRNALDGNKPARQVNLSASGAYAARVAADDAAWKSIGHRELVWFNGTNVLGVTIRGPEHNTAQQTINQTAAEQTTHRIRDVNGHGTATASTVLRNFPDAIVVMIQITTGAGLADATQWAASQPWIDVISTSFGATGNVPVPSGVSGGRLVFSNTPTFTRQAYNAGKVVVNSAGNDPSPLPTDHQDGPHWVIAVTGSQAEGEGKEVLSGNVFPDYVADYTVQGAVMDNVDDVYVTIGGTSFSCPTVAGTVAGVLHEVRTALNHAGGIASGELAPGVTNRDVRAALNKTALLEPWDGYVAGLNYNGDHAHPPGAPYLTAQWGHVDERVIGATAAAILADDYAIPPEKAAAAAWKDLTFRYRALFWDHVKGPIL